LYEKLPKRRYDEFNIISRKLALDSSGRKLINMATGKFLPGRMVKPFYINLSSDGLIAIEEDELRVSAINTFTGEVVFESPIDGFGSIVEFNGVPMVVISPITESDNPEDHYAHVYDLRTKALVGKFASSDLFHSQSALPIPGTSKVILCGRSGLDLVELESGPDRTAVVPKKGYVVTMAVSEDGRLLAAAEENGTIRMYQTSDWLETFVIPGLGRDIDGLCSTERTLFALSTVHGRRFVEEGRAMTWDLKTLNLTTYQKTDNYRLKLNVGGKEVHYDANLAHANETGFAGVDAINPPRTTYRETGVVYRMVCRSVNGLPEQTHIITDYPLSEVGRKSEILSRNGQWYARIDKDCVLQVFRVGSAKPVRKRNLNKYFVNRMIISGWLAISDDGNLVAVGLSFEEADILLFDFKKRSVRELRRSGDTYDSLAFDLPGQRLAAGDAYLNTIVVFDLVGKKKKKRALEAHPGNIRSLHFTSDGEYLASSASDSQILLWDSESYELMATLFSFEADGVSHWIAYTPDGEYNGSEGVEEWFCETENH
jgi:WD40 repeat protein